ncbi:hypothetical protein AB0L88_03180 [Saccharopolyspora shandongensis]|uniref:hypothetical protein n=1 Tax=Saccharopolyspora shandongensis TaxID=418495 RepID=UPI003413B0A0
MAPVQFTYVDLPTPDAVIVERYGHVTVVADHRVAGDYLANVLTYAQMLSEASDRRDYPRWSATTRRPHLGIVSNN